MSYKMLEKKLKSLPPVAIEEISSYIDYVFFKFSTSKKIIYTPTKKDLAV